MLLFPCPLGCEDLLETELVALGAPPTALRRGNGVVVLGEALLFTSLPPQEATANAARAAEELAVGMRALLHSRIASRVLLVLDRFAVDGDRALYAGVRALPWHEVMLPSASIAVDCPRGEGALHHTQYASQVCKDGIVDAMREQTGSRPDVDLRSPDVRIQVLLRRGEATISLDLAGEALHRRGYRRLGGTAPLKENLAAAMLMRARWPQRARAGALLVDPMCGSGTLLIEAAWMAAEVPPSLLRRDYALLHWRALPKPLWQTLSAEAQQQGERGLALLQTGALHGRIRGFDASSSQVQLARGALAEAKLHGHVVVQQGQVSALDLAPEAGPGLIVCTPLTASVWRPVRPP